MPYLLGVIMFCMGLTLTPPDFAAVAKRPWAVVLGIVAHYVIMPGAGWLIAVAPNLEPELAVGLILVGCAASGTASNVMAFLAKGDVALSVAVASVSTLIAPIVTPLLVLFLAGSYLQIDAGAMVGDIVKTVLLPVVAGLLARLFLKKLVAKVLPALPWASAVVISLIMAIVVAGSSSKIVAAGGIVFLAVVLHNGFGLGLGYLPGNAGHLKDVRIPPRRLLEHRSLHLRRHHGLRASGGGVEQLLGEAPHPAPQCVHHVVGEVNGWRSSACRADSTRNRTASFQPAPGTTAGCGAAHGADRRSRDHTAECQVLRFIRPRSGPHRQREGLQPARRVPVRSSAKRQAQLAPHRRAHSDFPPDC